MLSRRLFLKSTALIGCSAAAHPLLSSATFAAAPGDNRLVVIILRGAMDGLDGRTGIISYKRNVIVTPEGCPAWNWAVETGATVKSPEEN